MMIAKTTATPPPGARVPKTDKIKIPFQWAAVADMLEIDSVDFAGEGLTLERNRQHKRHDWQFSGLLESIREDGFYDPVYLYPEGDLLGNGHHRVIAALDLGYTHMPVTSDSTYQWESSIREQEYASFPDQRD